MIMRMILLLVTLVESQAFPRARLRRSRDCTGECEGKPGKGKVSGACPDQAGEAQ